MTKYKLEITYDPNTKEVTSRDVYKNWPEHHRKLREDAEERMRGLAEKIGLEGTIKKTITIK